MRWDRDQILERLGFLRRTDSELTRFGAWGHRYVLNEPLTESDVASFEARHGVSLPEEYRSFIVEVGDGGAGPFYGIVRLDRYDLDVSDREVDLSPEFLAGAFPHTQAWNEPGDGSREAEERYFDPARIRGSLNVCHQGCGYMVRLVLNGPQRGTLWEDGRCSDGGIAPLAPGFATWYSQWLSQ